MIDRDGPDLKFTWSGIDPATEYVVIRIQSVNFDTGVAGFVYCSADPAAGMFVVPQRVFSTLPNSSPWDGDGDPTALVSVSGDSRSSTGQIMASGLIGGRLYYSNYSIRTTAIE